MVCGVGSRFVALLFAAGFGRVDPHSFGQRGRLGPLGREAFGVLGVGCVKHVLAGLYALGRPAVVHVFRGEPAEHGIMVLCVVPFEKPMQKPHASSGPPNR